MNNVIPTFRRQGIGPQLIEEAERITRQNYDRVGLGVGLYKDYVPAQGLYTSHGNETPRRKGGTPGTAGATASRWSWAWW